MDADIGAKRPVEGDHVFLVGRFLTSESSFVLMYDQAKERSSKRNLKKVDPEHIVAQLGGEEKFARLDIPVWGSAWLRRSSVRQIVKMPTEHLSLSKSDVGAIIVFEHEADPVETGFPLNLGFSAYGLTVEEVAESLGRRCSA